MLNKDELKKRLQEISEKKNKDIQYKKESYNKPEAEHSKDLLVDESSEFKKLAEEYLDKYKEFKKLEKEIETMKATLKEYMNSHELDSIQTDLGSLTYSECDRVKITSRYSSYDRLELLRRFPDVAKRCSELVIDQDMIEDLIKSGQAPREIRNYKMTTKSGMLSVTLSK